MRKSSAQGSSLLTALFVMVILAGLTAMMLRIFNVDMAYQNIHLLRAQAHYATLSALEWAQHATGTFCNGANETETLTFPTGTRLAPFAVEVACVYAAHTAGSSTLPSHTFTLTTSSGTYGQLLYTAQSMTVVSYQVP